MKRPTDKQLEIYKLIHPEFEGNTLEKAANILDISVRAARYRLANMRKTHPNAFKFEKFIEPAELYSNNVEYIYMGYKTKANTNNLKFSISLEDFITIIQLECFICHQLPKRANRYNPKKAYYNKTGYKFDYNHLWRYDVTKGFTYENCVPMCFECIRRRRLHV